MAPNVSKLFSQLNYHTKVAIGLGRFKQYPLSEILNLWNEDPSKNICFSLNLHPQIKNINQSKLQFYLELQAIKITNLLGVDLNKAVQHEHLKSPLQFISGLGPRKANYLINKIFAENYLNSRISLLNLKIFQQKIYWNCSAFLKIKKPKKLKNSSKKNFNNELDSGYDFLDITRIHPSKYAMAKKIARSAMEENFNKDAEIAIKIIFNFPSKLNCLDLNEYILKNLEMGNKSIKQDIAYILDEFKNPFNAVNIQNAHIDLTPKEIFGLLIGDTSFRKGSYAYVKVIKSDKEHIKCKLANDLDGILWVKDVYDDDNFSEEKINQIHETFRNVSYIETRVKDINLHLFRVDLTAKPSALRNIKNYIEVDKLDKNFIITEDDWNLSQYSEYNLNKKSRNNYGLPNKYTPRNIKNPNYKNIDYTRVLDLLRNSEAGTHYFRPSSKGNNFLTLSWKFFDNCYSHLEIEEIEKQRGATISSKLILDKEVYYSLQEISEKYIKN